MRCPAREVPATRAFFVNLMTLSSRRLALSPARRGISRGVAMFIRHRQSRTFLLEPRNARSQTLLGLHHGQQSTLARPLRGHHRQPAPRAWEHKKKLNSGFTSRYNLDQLVYYEAFTSPDHAIDREKEIKGWRRGKKIRLIESLNPHWYDLAAAWGDVYKPDFGKAPREIPRPAGENAGTSG